MKSITQMFMAAGILPATIAPVTPPITLEPINVEIGIIAYIPIYPRCWIIVIVSSSPSFTSRYPPTIEEKVRLATNTCLSSSIKSVNGRDRYWVSFYGL